MISTETLIGWGATAATIIGHAFVVNYRVNRNETEIENLWKWKTGHEKEASELRAKYQEQLSELKGAQLVVNEKLAQILMKVQEILDRVIQLENNRNGRN